MLYGALFLWERVGAWIGFRGHSIPETVWEKPDNPEQRKT
jgi:hypothetical protein